MHEVQPDMMIIVIMRDPIERLYSAFWYYGCLYGLHGSNMTAASFHESATREVRVVQDCLASGGSMRACARESFGAAQQIVKGMYAAFAPDWLAVYPRNQLMWIKAEDYFADERKYLEARCRCQCRLYHAQWHVQTCASSLA